MGIEDSISRIDLEVRKIYDSLNLLHEIVKDLNEKVDLLTIRKQVDRTDKEKRIKHTMTKEQKEFIDNSIKVLNKEPSS
jgi:hypothetical protein